MSSYQDTIVASTHAFWRESTDAVIECLDSDCAATTSRLSAFIFGGAVTGIAVAGNTFYAKPAPSPSGNELRSCNETDCLAITTVTASNAIAPPFHILDGNAYWLVDAPPGKQPMVCALANCRSGASVAADTDATELAVDETGVYWIGATGELRSCPLAGCPPAGPATLASGRSHPRS